MQTVWHLKGGKAGTFECVSDDVAAALAESCEAQICDGVTPLKYPEGHPDHKPSRPRKRNAKPRYPDKMMRA